MHRRYYKIDGDSYVRKYDNTRQHCYTITDSEVYTNYVQGSDNSIFKYHVDKNMKEEFKDFNYLSCPISKNEYMWFGIIIGILNFIVVFAI